MISNKSYLIRAFYDWIVDSECTPLLLVDATFPRCNVPRDFIENNQILLNVSPQSIRDLKINRLMIEFKASFSGVVHLISVPIKAVLSVYAEENGQGMFFDYEEPDESDWEGDGFLPDTVTEFPKADNVTHLKIVDTTTETT